MKEPFAVNRWFIYLFIFKRNTNMYRNNFISTHCNAFHKALFHARLFWGLCNSWHHLFNQTQTTEIISIERFSKTQNWVHPKNVLSYDFFPWSEVNQGNDSQEFWCVISEALEKDQSHFLKNYLQYETVQPHEFSSHQR